MIGILLTLACILPYNYEIVCEGKSISVEAVKVAFQDYVPLKSVADLLGANYVYDNNTQRLYLTVQNRQLEIIGNVPVIRQNTAYKNIPFAPLYINGDIYFPVHEIIPTIGTSFEKLMFIKEIKEAPLIDNIELVQKGDSTILRFSWPRTIDFDVQFLMKKAIIEIDGQYPRKPAPQAVGAVSHVQLLPYTTYTRLELDLAGVNAYLERGEEVIFYYKISHAVNLIVVDPGHGGIDPGAVGKKGLYEKDANLEIARFLRQYIEDSLGIRIIMTREKDEYLSLKARTNIANRHSADLFVSVHCNASGKSSKMRGFETYFLSEARTTEARAVEALENASLKFDDIEPDDELTMILYDLAQSAYLEESNRFAESIQDHAQSHLSIPSRGVKQAGFYVLRGAFMPAVLIECAFVSNLEEERMLKQKSFRRELALCIFRGIKYYIADYERRLNN